MAKKKRPWNKGKIIGRKRPLTPEQVASIRTLLSQRGNVRNMALFGVAIDSSLGRAHRTLTLNLHSYSFKYSPN